ncbi:MAG: hypothetical protein EXR83_09695 [Gammaproteobacteria bacterium]|nr:hypothetical protein [Gammaproteobacteria bacterium]
MNHRHLTQAPTRGALLKGNRAALHCGGRALSWTQFAQRIASLAGVLQDFGVVAGTPVAMLAEAGIEYFDYHYAVPWARWGDGAAQHPAIGRRTALHFGPRSGRDFNLQQRIR